MITANDLNCSDTINTGDLLYCYRLVYLVNKVLMLGYNPYVLIRSIYILAVSGISSLYPERRVKIMLTEFVGI